MKKLLFISISLLIGITLALIFSELFLRANPNFGYISSSYKPFSADSLKTQMWRKRPSSLLGYENIPNVSGVNSYGLVNKEYQLKKKMNTFRILILGDSVGEGLDMDFFEDLLNQDSILHPKYNFEIWNGSVGGYDVRRYYLYLKHRGLGYRPDMIIIFLCLNDFGIDSSVYYKDERGVVRSSFHASSELMRRYPPNLFLMRYSYLYRFIILRLNSYLLSSEEKSDGSNSEKTEGEEYLASIKDICDENHLPLIAVVFPYLKPISEYKDFERQQHGDIMRAIKKLNINYFDLHEYVPQLDLYSLRVVKADEIHTKGEKSHPILKIIYDYLLNNFSEIYSRLINSRNIGQD